MPAVLMALAVAFLVQAAGQPYTGQWTAELAGTTFVRLELTERNGQLTGSLALGNIKVDSQGEVNEAEPVGKAVSIGDAAVRDGMLTFTRLDDDHNRFEMRVADGSARLTLIVPPEVAAELKEAGIPVPRPILLKRSVQ